MKFKSGDLVILVSATNIEIRHMVGEIYQLGEKSEFFEDSWYFNPALTVPDGRTISWWEGGMRPIRDQPGNESWFTAAPRSKPATTKGDTINERGEIA